MLVLKLPVRIIPLCTALWLLLRDTFFQVFVAELPLSAMQCRLVVL